MCVVRALYGVLLSVMMHFRLRCLGVRELQLLDAAALPSRD